MFKMNYISGQVQENITLTETLIYICSAKFVWSAKFV